MFDYTLWFEGLAALVVFAVAGWLLSLPLRNVSIVDIMWSLMFLLAAVTYTVGQVATVPRAWLVIALVGLWAIRLSGYICWRNFGQGEDFRYRKIRANNEPGFAFKSLYIVFGLQAGLAWVISLPLLIFSLGLFTLVINAVLLSLVGGMLQPGFVVEGFGAAFWGGVIISVVSLLVNGFLGRGARVHVQGDVRGSTGRRRARNKDDDEGGPVIDV